MKKTLSILLALIMLTGILTSVKISVFSASESDLRFTLNNDEKSYSVTDCRMSAKGEVIIPQVYNNLPVTCVGYQAFAECEDITSVVIPGSVKTIEYGAFKDCVGLVTVSMQEGVIDIGEEAFCGGESLYTVIVPDSVEHIGIKAFYDTELYKNSNNWENGVLYLGNHLISVKEILSGGYIIKPGTITIADSAFKYSVVETVTIPDSVTQIPYGAFSNSMVCTIVIPDSVNTISERAFSECKNLESIEIPDATTRIGEYAFYSCEELYSIKLPEHYIEIGESAFYRSGYYDDSFNWENGFLYIDDHLIQYESAFYETYEIKEGTIAIANNAFEYCKNIKQIDLPDSVLGIGDSAFIGCSSLEKVSFGKNLEIIGDLAFSGTKITSVKLPANIETIGSEAFTTVESAVIPRKIKYIGANAFGSSFKYLFYTGSKAEWKNVIIDSDNSFLLKSAIHYNSTDHTLVDGFCKKCDYSWFVFWLSGDDYYELDYCRTIAKGDVVIPRKYKGLPVRGMDGYAFQDCKKVTSVVIPKGITQINTATFLRCSNLKSVTIPKSVENINTAAFYQCNKLSEVYYQGSTSEWDRVYISPQNDKLLNAKLFCYPDNPVLGSARNIENGIEITWRKIKNADSYTILRKKGSGKWTVIKENVKSTRYVDKTAKIGVKYKYTVKAKNEMGFSGYDTKGISFIRTIKAPSKMTAKNTKEGIVVRWNKVKGATGYFLMRNTGKGKTETIAWIKDTTYTDKKVKSGYNYKYTIEVYGDSGVAYNITGVTIKRLLAPKLNNVVTVKSGITLKWNKVTGAGGYVVYRKAGNGKFTKLATIKGISNVSYTDKSAKKGTMYTYKLKAYSGNTYSADSNAKTIKDKY